MTSWRRWVSVLVLLALTAACGSTVRNRAASPDGGSNELSDRGGAGGSNALVDTNPGGTPGASGSGTVRGGTRQRTGGGSTAENALVGGKPVGPGVTADAVKIGFEYFDMQGGTTALFGGDVSLGDSEGQARAVADYINKHGGVGGKRLDLDVYGTNFYTYANDTEGESGKMCARYTQDVRVLALSTLALTPSLLDCLSKKGTVIVSEQYPLTESRYSQYADYYYSPGEVSVDRAFAMEIPDVAKTGYLKGARFGIVYSEEPSFATTLQPLRDMLKRAGVASITEFGGPNDNVQNASATSSAAVLRMAADQVTHILFYEMGSALAFEFMTAAESQRYRPKYLVTTNSKLGTLAQLVPSAQLENALAMSWSPYDTQQAADESPPAVSATRALCYQIYKDAGADLSTRTAEGEGMLICDQLLFIKTMIDRAAAPRAQEMRAAADQLGTSYQSPLNYSTIIGRGRHAGAAVTRYIHFDGGCSCWKYLRPGPTG